MPIGGLDCHGCPSRKSHYEVDSPARKNRNITNKCNIQYIHALKIQIYENAIVGKYQSNRKQVKYLGQGLEKLPVMCVSCDGSSGVSHPPVISVHNKYN